MYLLISSTGQDIFWSKPYKTFEEVKNDLENEICSLSHREDIAYYHTYHNQAKAHFVDGSYYIFKIIKIDIPKDF